MLWSPSVVNSVGGCSRTRAVKAWFTLSNEKRRTGVVEIVPIFRPSFGPMAQAKERRDRGATDTAQAKITEYGKVSRENIHPTHRPNVTVLLPNIT